MAVERVPVQLKQLGPQTLGIVWSDGHCSFHRARTVRLSCRCAHCVDEWTHEKKLADSDVPADIQPRKIESVGRYALRFIWSDGHDTGFHTFDSLRAICECPACQKA